MLPTERGRTWFARWHNTTPSVSAGAISSGRVIFKRVSIICRSCSISSVSSFCLSNSRRIVKLSLSVGTSRFQETVLFVFCPGLALFTYPTVAVSGFWLPLPTGEWPPPLVVGLGIEEGTLLCDRMPLDALQGLFGFTYA